MVRIWGKVYKGEKLLKHASIEVNERECTFFDMLRKLAEKLDIATPVLLEKHVKDFNKFNMCMFKADDFVEKVNFTKFILENITE